MSSNFTLPDNPTPDELAQCTPDICPINSSFYMYRINLVPNAVFLGIFGVHFLAFCGVWAATRRGAVFTVPFLFGIACEIIGYAGRIKSWYNQWLEDGFLIQIVCLTIGPAFLSAGVYLCLSRIVAVYGPENSRIKAGWYTRIFIPCDIVSLILQAGGGTASSIALQDQTSLDPGDNAMLAGLVLQVVTLFIFILLCADFGWRTWRNIRRLGAAAALPQDPALVRIRESRRFKGFLLALAIAVITIFWRSVYRSAELSQGWTGPLQYDQYLFYGFEGVMIVVAVSALLIFHPALCLGTLINHNGTRAATAGTEKPAAEPAEEDREMTKFPASSGGSSGETTESGEPSVVPDVAEEQVAGEQR